VSLQVVDVACVELLLIQRWLVVVHLKLARRQKVAYSVQRKNENERYLVCLSAMLTTPSGTLKAKARAIPQFKG